MRRKRFFVLTDNKQLRYYKTEDTRQPVAGTIHLNWYVRERGTLNHVTIVMTSRKLTVMSHGNGDVTCEQ